MTRRLTRRQVLASGTASLAALAGCSDRADPGRSPAFTKTPTFTKSIEVDSRHLAVTLPDRHDIDRLTLVDPDGSHFATKPVQTGVTQVRFELLDPQLWGGGYDHYDPGVYELVAASKAQTYRQDVPLEPEVRVIGVEQVRSEELPRYLSGLVVTLDNVGTGPTWIYDIAFDNSPYGLADGVVRDGIGTPIFAYPEIDEFSAISPSERQDFISTGKPLVFSDSPACSGGNHIMEIRVGVATSEEVRQTIRLTPGGETTEYPLSRRWLCEEVSVEMIDDS